MCSQCGLTYVQLYTNSVVRKLIHLALTSELLAKQIGSYTVTHRMRRTSRTRSVFLSQKSIASLKYCIFFCKIRANNVLMSKKERSTQNLQNWTLNGMYTVQVWTLFYLFCLICITKCIYTITQIGIYKFTTKQLTLNDLSSVQQYLEETLL